MNWLVEQFVFGNHFDELKNYKIAVLKLENCLLLKSFHNKANHTRNPNFSASHWTELDILTFSYKSEIFGRNFLKNKCMFSTNFVRIQVLFCYSNNFFQKLADYLDRYNDKWIFRNFPDKNLNFNKKKSPRVFQL